MKATELTVEVNAKLSISDDTADRCLRLLEMWQDDNPNKFIEVERICTELGMKTIFRIKEKKHDSHSW